MAEPQGDAPEVIQDPTTGQYFQKVPGGLIADAQGNLVQGPGRFTRIAVPQGRAPTGVRVRAPRSDEQNALDQARAEAATSNAASNAQRADAATTTAESRIDLYGPGGEYEKRFNNNTVRQIANDLTTQFGVPVHLKADERGFFSIDPTGLPPETLAAGKQKFDQAMQLGTALGVVNGSPTLAAQGQAFEQALQGKKLGLEAQGQAFGQENTLANRAIELGRNPSDYLNYSFLSAGKQAPQGTALGDVLGRLGKTPTVASAMGAGSPYGGPAQTTTVGQPAPTNQRTTGAMSGPPDIAQAGNYDIPTLKAMFTPEQLAMLPSDQLGQFSNDDLLAIEKAKPGTMAALFGQLPEGARKNQLAPLVQAAALPSSHGVEPPQGGTDTTQRLQGAMTTGMGGESTSALPQGGQNGVVQSGIANPALAGAMQAAGNPAAVATDPLRRAMPVATSPIGAGQAGIGTGESVQPLEASGGTQGAAPGFRLPNINDVTSQGLLPPRVGTALGLTPNTAGALAIKPLGGVRPISAQMLGALSPTDKEALSGTLSFMGNRPEDMYAQAGQQSSAGFNGPRQNRLQDAFARVA